MTSEVWYEKFLLSIITTLFVFLQGLKFCPVEIHITNVKGFFSSLVHQPVQKNCCILISQLVRKEKIVSRTETFHTENMISTDTGCCTTVQMGSIRIKKKKGICIFFIKQSFFYFYNLQLMQVEWKRASYWSCSCLPCCHWLTAKHYVTKACLSFGTCISDSSCLKRSVYMTGRTCFHMFSVINLHFKF